MICTTSSRNSSFWPTSAPPAPVRLVDELHDEVKEKHLKTGQEALDALRGIICQELTPRYPMDLDGKPAVILVIGVNGVGKTTTIAKLAGLYKKQGRRVMLAAGDTFRAAASEQLELWAERATCAGPGRHGRGTRRRSSSTPSRAPTPAATTWSLPTPPDVCTTRRA